MEKGVLRKIRQGVLYCFAMLLIAAFLFVLTEGIIHTWTVTDKLLSFAPTKKFPESVHTKFDRDLGWANLPNYYQRDLYGPGVYLKTNGQGFRNVFDTSETRPEDILRIVCSGDSFTLGFGVSNSNAWCNRLKRINPSIEPINMGQGGYGIGQAYLWYLRDGQKLEHDVHIFSVITDDFVRAADTRFATYNKPKLTVINGVLEVDNVPVPRRWHWLEDRRHMFKEFSTVSFLNSIVTHTESDYAETSERLSNSIDMQLVVTKLFRKLKEINSKKRSSLLVVYHPTSNDWLGRSSDKWRKFLREKLGENDIRFLDLVEKFREEDHRVAHGLHFHNHYHYNRSGNGWAAKHIFKEINSFANVRAKLKSEIKTSSDHPWRVVYYPTIHFRGQPLETSAKTLEFEWRDSSPGPDIPADKFSAKATTCLELDNEQEVTFFLGSDDGAKLTVNETLLIDNWKARPYRVTRASTVLPAGKHLILVEYFEAGGEAVLTLDLSLNDSYPESVLSPSAYPPVNSSIASPVCE